MTSKGLATQPQFVKPYFIEILGQDGLTAHDIAHSLGVETRDVLQKLRRGKWTGEEDWRGVAYTTTNESNGLPLKSFALTVDGAKAFVARWVNHLGDAYLKYLFACETALMAAIPEIARLREENAALKVRKKRFGLDKKDYPVLVVTAKKVVTNIFGDSEVVAVREKINLRGLPRKVAAAWMMRHTAACNEGNARKLAKLAKIVTEDETGAIDVLPPFKELEKGDDK